MRANLTASLITSPFTARPYETLYWVHDLVRRIIPVVIAVDVVTVKLPLLYYLLAFKSSEFQEVEVGHVFRSKGLWHRNWTTKSFIPG